MATNDLSTKAKICDAALALLRQDIGYGTSVSVSAKCDNVWSVACEALRGAHDWSTTWQTGSDTIPSSQRLRGILVYALARELAIPITGRQEDLKNICTLYEMVLREGIVDDLESQIGSLTDAMAKKVLSILQPYFTADEKSVLPHSVSNMILRITTATTEVEHEVMASHAWATGTTASSSHIAPVVEIGVAAKIAAAAGLGVEHQAALMKMYDSMLSAAKEKDIEDQIANESDATVSAVFGIVQPYVSAVQGGAPFDYAVMKKRISATKTSVFNAIMNAHNWSSPPQTETVMASSALLGPAYVAGIARAVAGAGGVGVEQVQLLDREYANRLQEAISKDLEAEMESLRAMTDDASKFAANVLGVMRQYYSVADGKFSNGMPKAQPRGIAILVSHINTIKERIRKNILLSYEWSFAKGEVGTNSTRINGRFETAVPGECDRIVNCTWHGEQVDFVIRNDRIVSSAPIDRIVYVYDDGTTDYWSALAVNAYVYAVAKEAVAAVPMDALQVQAITAAATEALENARTDDARTGGKSKSKERSNFIFDCMVGRRDPIRKMRIN